MGWFFPILSLVGRTIYRRPILSALGTVVAWEFVDADGNIVGEFAEDALSGALSELGDIGIDTAESIAGGIGEAIPEIIERIGPSIVKGVNNTVEAIRQELKGQEVKVISTFMIFFLSWVSGVYILSWVRGVGMRAGE